MPPPRSHSLEQHNYADHKKQPTTATGKDTKDKTNPFQKVLKENPWTDTLYYMISKITKAACPKKSLF